MIMPSCMLSITVFCCVISNKAKSHTHTHTHTHTHKDGSFTLDNFTNQDNSIEEEGQVLTSNLRRSHNVLNFHIREETKRATLRIRSPSSTCFVHFPTAVQGHPDCFLSFQVVARQKTVFCTPFPTLLFYTASLSTRRSSI